VAIKIFLALGNRVLRDALARVLRNKGMDSVEVCGVSDSDCTPQLAEAVSAADSEVLITEANPSVSPESRLLRQVFRLSPNIKILIVDMEDEATFLESVRDGAVGFLLRDCSAADLLTAVRTIAQGQAFCPPRLCLALLNHISTERLPLPSIQVKLQLGLTRRQQQIVPFIAKGLTNKEIACHLNLSEQTIKNHIHSMLRRTGANGRLAVVDLTRQTTHLSKAAT
jgi:DNA-binding NarL/FixJ family response regulator